MCSSDASSRLRPAWTRHLVGSESLEAPQHTHAQGLGEFVAGQHADLNGDWILKLGGLLTSVPIVWLA